jgi:hypothetical protein
VKNILRYVVVITFVLCLAACDKLPKADIGIVSVSVKPSTRIKPKDTYSYTFELRNRGPDAALFPVLDIKIINLAWSTEFGNSPKDTVHILKDQVDGWVCNLVNTYPPVLLNIVQPMVHYRCMRASLAKGTSKLKLEFRATPFDSLLFMVADIQSFGVDSKKHDNDAPHPKYVHVRTPE